MHTAIQDLEAKFGELTQSMREVRRQMERMTQAAPAAPPVYRPMPAGLRMDAPRDKMPHKEGSIMVFLREGGSYLGNIREA